MLYIFIVESGQFVKTPTENYFVVASFEINEPRKTRKSFRAWCKSKFPKHLRFQSEIKFADSGISDTLRLQTLRCISKLGIQVRYVYFKIENIPHEFWRKEKLESGSLYLYTITTLLSCYPPFENNLFVQVTVENSMAETNIQIADWIVGAIARYLNSKILGAESFKIIQDILAEPGVELFKNKTPNNR